MRILFSICVVLCLVSSALSLRTASVTPRLIESSPNTMLLRRLGVIPRTTLSLRAVSTQHDLLARLRDKSSSFNNIPEGIVEKVGRNLHLQQHHPLNIIKRRIENYCNDYAQAHGQSPFQICDNQAPIASTKACFDDLRVPPDHVSRRPTDTYYLDRDTVLRTHTSAHQTQFMAQGIEAFLCSGDVYRRDEIDASHYPVFHQMEGVRIFSKTSPAIAGLSEEQRTEFIVNDLKGILGGLAKHLFGDVEMRWNSEYFPFTDPSFELEVLFQGKWLEVLGCGVVHRDVMVNGQRGEDFGWAFGLGLERLAMVLFGIPDIRLFWTDDQRFLSQFDESKKSMTFVPYSKFPVCYKDVSFWLPDSGLHPNDIYELIRGIAGDLVESVELFDQFTNKKTGKTSHAYRINYRHMDRSLTNEEINEVQMIVRKQLEENLKVTLR